MESDLIKWVPFIAAVMLAVGSGAGADCSAGGMRSAFVKECQTRKFAGQCRAIADRYHDICQRKSTPRRYHKQIWANSPDRAKYMNCMRGELASQSYQAMTLAERERRGLRH